MSILVEESISVPFLGSYLGDKKVKSNVFMLVTCVGLVPSLSHPRLEAPPHNLSPEPSRGPGTQLSNILLGGLVIFATFVTLCNGSCYVIHHKIVPGESIKECTDLKGNKHPIDSRWRTEDCELCACHDIEISCCSLVSTPVGYDRHNCQKIFKKETCKITVVEKKDPNRTCGVSGWIS
ncbi:beta-microseminoprotein E1 [Aotus nancymaae]|uniref:beta-microseminoprotein E1 n=1 Tax=Aotus nancymaae TaxID=37293 RepID=UPI0030FEC024